MNYEILLAESDSAGLIVKEKPLKYNDGRIRGKRIAIRNTLSTSTEKGCVLAEELGHHYTTVGNILEQTSYNNQKQEYRARIWAYNKLIGLNGIVSAYKAKCQNLYEMAEHLDVTEEFLKEALDCYRSKYGPYVKLDNYIIYFEPNIGILELI